MYTSVHVACTCECVCVCSAMFALYVRFNVSRVYCSVHLCSMQQQKVYIYKLNIILVQVRLVELAPHASVIQSVFPEM